MDDKLKILHLEDNENDSELLQLELEKESIIFIYDRVDKEEDFVKRLLKGDFDIILSDYSLPAYNGLKALQKAMEIKPDIPFILVSGTLGEDAAVESMRRGATDYVIKNNLNKLGPIIKRALDVVREKRMRRMAEEKYGKLIEAARDVIFTISDTGRLLTLNKAFENITGHRRADWIGLEFSGLIHPEDLHIAVDRFRSAVSGQALESYEIRFSNNSGGYLYGEVLTTPLNNTDGTMEVLGIVRDVTERRKSEQMIRDSLKEKEILLKEIHHRVKNNLQIILSLINLQSSDIKDPSIVSSLREIQNRVISMSLIHQSFYQSSNLTDVDFTAYIRKLVDNLFNIFGVSKERVSIKLSSPGYKLSIDMAIPLGLLVNEILSNSLKYAFPEERKGSIHIELSEAKDNYKLIIGDDGCGIPTDIHTETSSSMGMTLIRMLCEQLDAVLRVNSDNGTVYELEFFPRSYKDRLKEISRNLH